MTSYRLRLETQTFFMYSSKRLCFYNKWSLSVIL